MGGDDSRLSSWTTRCHYEDRDGREGWGEGAGGDADSVSGKMRWRCLWDILRKVPSRKVHAQVEAHL